MAQALNPLIAVLEWYFDQDWVEGSAPAKPGKPDPPVDTGFGPVHVGGKPERGWSPRLVVGLAFALGVMLAAVIAVGFSGMFRGRETTSPGAEPTARTVAEPVTPAIAAKAPRSDEDRIQGRWQSVEGQANTRKTAGIKETDHVWIWTFRGTHLSTGSLADGKVQANDRGTFSLSRSGEQRLFDFEGTRPNGADGRAQGNLRV